MRDGRAFMVALEEYALGLHLLFKIRLKDLKSSCDHASIVKELVETTIERTLKYSRKVNYRDRDSIKTLLFIKAEDVWEEYLDDYNIKIAEELRGLSDGARKALSPLHKSVFVNQVKAVNDKMARTRVNIITLRFHGYDNEDISKILNITADAIKMNQKGKSEDKSGNKEGTDC